MLFIHLWLVQILYIMLKLELLVRIDLCFEKLHGCLDDQTQVDSKPAGQPEHASLNQCQLIAANRPELMLWAPPAGGGDKVSL